MGQGSRRLKPPTHFERAGSSPASVDKITMPKKASSVCKLSLLKIGSLLTKAYLHCYRLIA